MALSLQYYINYTANEVKLQRRSQAAVDANHVLKFTHDSQLQHVEAVVQASMKNQSYKVKIDLDSSFGISYSECDCPLRYFKCHHVAAVLLFGYRHVSKTDIKCAWLQKPKSQPVDTKTVADMFPKKAYSRPVSQDDRDAVFTELSKLGLNEAQHWLLSPEPTTASTPVPLVEDLLVSKEYIEADNQTAWLRKALLLSVSAIDRAQQLTIGQRQNPLWSQLRKLRLTASNFGAILKAATNKRYPMSLKKRLLAAYCLDSSHAVVWGVTHEEVAVGWYRSCGAEVNPSGIWLHESGVLGASPDGLIVCPPTNAPVFYHTEQAMTLQPAILEVKCPYAARAMTILQAASTLKNFYIVKMADDSMKLSEKHDYWHQIQGQLYLTKSSCCDLVVWTSVDARIFRIAADPVWCSNIQRLLDFYFFTFIPSFDSDA